MAKQPEPLPLLVLAEQIETLVAETDQDPDMARARQIFTELLEELNQCPQPAESPNQTPIQQLT